MSTSLGPKTAASALTPLVKKDMSPSPSPYPIRRGGGAYRHASLASRSSYLSLRDLSMVSFGILMGMASLSIFGTFGTVPSMEAGRQPHGHHPLTVTTGTKGHHLEPGPGQGHGGGGKTQRPTFILFGDSLTQRGYEPENSGWVSHLSNAYIRRVDILNRGFSGWNSRWCRLVMEDLFPQWESGPRPLLVVVFLGANDAALPDRAQHATLVEYTGNLNAIIDHFKSRDGQVSLILLTPPPVDESKWGQHCKNRGRELDRLNSITRQYAQACMQVGKEQGVTVVDLWTALGGNDPKAHALHLNDGLHFSGSGNRVVFEELMKAVRRDHPHLLPDALPLQGPEHYLIDRYPQSLDVGLSMATSV